MRPILGITMGDMCGIGPEITLKALMEPDTYQKCRPLVVGSASVMEEMIDLLGAEAFSVHVIKHVAEAEFVFGTIEVYDVPITLWEGAIPYGQVTAAGGDSAFFAVKKVIEMAMAGEIDGSITGPLNKEAINLAGHHFSGHTEIYAHYTQTNDYAMMLADEHLRVVHVSTHVSLREACDRVKAERIRRVIELADEACRNLGIQKPRIAVAALNPHAGEGGLFGREEVEEIIPAINKARAAGIDAEGPVPADTIFSKARGGMYDIAVVMYHDQGHIPIKVTGFVYNQEEQRTVAACPGSISRF